MPYQVQRYQPSGFFRPVTIAIFAAALVGGVAAAWLYQLLVHWIPFIYLNLLIAVGFGALLGTVGARAVKVGHCRNRMLAVVLAVPLALGAVLASHYWEYRSVLGQLADANPGATMAQVKEEFPFAKYLEAKEKVGWSLSSHGGSGGAPIDGKLIYGVYGVEALLFLGMVLSIVLSAAGQPYCERCNLWCTEQGIAIAGLGKDHLEPLLSRGDVDAVVDVLPPAPPEPNVAMTLMASTCGGCEETGFLSVTEKRVIPKKKGKAETKEKALVKYVVLGFDQRARFLKRIPGYVAPVAVRKMAI